LGIDAGESDEGYLPDLLEKFKDNFPPRKVFSAYARDTLPRKFNTDDPDEIILAWMEHEEMLFRTLERHIVGDRLSKGFGNDVDGFVAYSLSVQNRRKSRVGHALENHLEFIFKSKRIRYARQAVTENKAKPDFLFPGRAEYLDLTFSVDLLSVLGVKSTCKDRWRQVLSEAKRIPDKHLFTLEPGISENQTDEMKSNRVQLVVPQGIHETYRASQREWIMNLGGFIELVKRKEKV